jgi:hypothetical protein
MDASELVLTYFFEVLFGTDGNVHFSHDSSEKYG